MKPLNISTLVRAWAARGEKIASSGPSMTPVWLQAKITGPVLGTWSVPWRVIR